MRIDRNGSTEAGMVLLTTDRRWSVTSCWESQRTFGNASALKLEYQYWYTYGATNMLRPVI